MHTGNIFNIQKYSIHDGPGIRTTVFMKGCPLSCWWCHNPESQKLEQELMFWEKRCIGCGACIKVCTTGAITVENNKMVFHRDKCTNCGKCINVCRPKARQYMGNRMTVDEVMKEIMKDQMFYDESKGGVTFSGGEPLMQHEFLYDLLERCKEEGIHTTLDTSGFASWSVLNKIADKTDLFLYDIKHMDNEMHKKYMGVPNDVILENVKKLSDRHSNIFARLPIIPGINDDEENIRKTGEFLSKLSIIQVNLLPYHNISKDKYNRLSTEYKLNDLKDPSKEHMENLSQRLSKFGLKVKIGG